MRLLYGLLAGLILSISFACHPSDVEVVAQTQSSCVRLHVPGKSCTAFSVGDELFVTAAHCVIGQPLVYLDTETTSYVAVPIIINEITDLATVRPVRISHIPSLKIWSIRTADAPAVGRKILSFGYPGYSNLEFTFEEGRIKGLAISDQDVEIILSSGISYPGESGGPVIDLETGLVVGVNSRMREVIKELSEDLHQHHTISLVIGAPEIEAIIARSKMEVQ